MLSIKPRGEFLKYTSINTMNTKLYPFVESLNCSLNKSLGLYYDLGIKFRVVETLNFLKKCKNALEHIAEE